MKSKYLLYSFDSSVENVCAQIYIKNEWIMKEEK